MAFSLVKISKRNGLFNKIISILIIQTFLLSNIPIGRQVSALAIPQEKEIITDPAGVVISTDAGIIKSKFTGNNERLII